MMDQSIFWSAFARYGLLAEAIHTAANGTSTTFQVGFVQPDILMLQNDVQSSQPEIEYQTADFSAMTAGIRLVINGDVYRVQNAPARQGSGHFSKVKVRKMTEEKCIPESK